MLERAVQPGNCQGYNPVIHRACTVFQCCCQIADTALYAGHVMRTPSRSQNAPAHTDIRTCSSVTFSQPFEQNHGIRKWQITSSLAPWQRQVRLHHDGTPRVGHGMHMSRLVPANSIEQTRAGALMHSSDIGSFADERFPICF